MDVFSATFWWEQLLAIDALQAIVLIFGVAEVLFARNNSLWLYPCGLISTSVAVYSLFVAQLYAESALNVYYVVMTMYGWWLWTRSTHKTVQKVSFSSRKEWFVSISIVVGSFLLLYYVLLTFTASDVPMWDAWVSATAWAGMWLLAKRKVENWIFLNISNAFAIPLLLYKSLPLLMVLTLFLFLVAISGYFHWRKQALKK